MSEQPAPVPETLEAEWARRGAQFRGDAGAIITALGQNSEDFRKRVAAAMKRPT